MFSSPFSGVNINFNDQTLTTPHSLPTSSSCPKLIHPLHPFSLELPLLAVSGHDTSQANVFRTFLVIQGVRPDRGVWLIPWSRLATRPPCPPRTPG